MYWFKGLLVFLMLCEWVFPLPVIARFQHFEVVLPLLGWFSFIAMLRIPFLLKEFLKMAGSAYAIYYLFHGMLKIGQSWKNYLILEFWFNYEKVSRLDFATTTAIARTLVFILLLWLAVSIVYKAVLFKNQGIWFALTTIAYFLLLDFSSHVDVKWSFVRTVFWILLLFSIQQMKFAERQGIRPNRYYWLFSSLAMILALTSIAYFLPKTKEGEVISFRFMNQDIPQYHRVGYSSGDHKLGGAFIDDESIVFYAKTPERQYWRGESRSIYTGSQWKDAKGSRMELSRGRQLGLHPLIQNMKIEENKGSTRVKFVQAKYDILFYGGQPKELKRLDPQNGSLYTTGNQEIRVDYASNGQAVSEYEMVTEFPLINEEWLKESSSDYEKDIHEYLQLPLGLPNRVRELAGKMTEGINDPYSKAVAIQQYLKGKAGLVYEKKEVPYLQPGQDFVDQFLFESKKGYCDHFSTSMTVLLRASGIPARYVKGFSNGEMVRGTDGMYDVTIRNKNAHSWTEVYFAGYGWVPFEPTPGFTNPIKRDDQQEKTEQKDIPVQPIQPEVPEDDPFEKLGELKNDFIQGRENLIKSSWLYYLLTAAALAVGLWAWKARNRIRFRYLYWRVQKVDQVDSLSSMYLTLVSLLGSVFSKRKTSESLLEYVDRLNVSREVKEDLVALTTFYEKNIYGKSKSEPKELDDAKNRMIKILRHFFS